MKRTQLIRIAIACLLTTACAQTEPSISEEAVSRYATEISDACKLYAAEAIERGQEFIPSYSRCIDMALLYLEARRKHNEPNEETDNKMSILDVAEGLAKEHAKDEAGSKLKDYAKSKISLF